MPLVPTISSDQGSDPEPEEREDESDAEPERGNPKAAAGGNEVAEDFVFDDGSFGVDEAAQSGWDFRGAMRNIAANERMPATGGIAAMEERISSKRRELKERQKRASREKVNQTAAHIRSQRAVSGKALAGDGTAGESGVDESGVRELEKFGVRDRGVASKSDDGDNDEHGGGFLGEDALRNYEPKKLVRKGDTDATAANGAGERTQAEGQRPSPATRIGAGDSNEAEGEEARLSSNFFLEEVDEEQTNGDVLTFQALNLSRPILRGIEALGFVSPTPVQARVIPLALAGRDVCASAATGSGKTAAFVLPALERLQYRPRLPAATRVLVVTPTRELAAQIQSMVEALARYTDVRCCLIVGGAKNLRAQESELRQRPEIVICTPGRMVDHLTNSQGIHLDDLDILILDEADRLLELGFQDEVTALTKSCSLGRQTMLFSATMNTKVAELVRLSLSKPVRVRADPLNRVVPRLVQEFIRIRKSREGDREAILLSLLCRTFSTRSIVFFDTKVQAHRAVLLLGLAGLAAAELHGNLTMVQRLEALERFKAGAVHVLVATDLAARGLDVAGVHTVINFEMPRTRDTYIHRVGRTARAGCNGRAVTLIGEERRLVMKEVLRSRGRDAEVKSRAVPQSAIDYYRGKIEEMEDAIDALLKEEKLDRERRMAEVDMARAANLIEHREEIMARPARGWISSTKRKAELASAMQAQARAESVAAAGKADVSNAAIGPSRVKASHARGKKLTDVPGDAKPETAEKQREERAPHGMTRKKRRRLEAAKDEVTYDDGEEGGGGRKMGSSHVAIVKQAKRAERQRDKELKDTPLTAARKNNRQGDSSAALFDVDLSEAKSTKLAATGGDEGKKKGGDGSSRYRFTAFDPSKRLRRQGKPGKQKFKSKAKHKRR